MGFTTERGKLIKRQPARKWIVLPASCCPRERGRGQGSRADLTVSESSPTGHLAVWTWVPAVPRGSPGKQAASTWTVHLAVVPSARGKRHGYLPCTPGGKGAPGPSWLVVQRTQRERQGHFCQFCHLHHTLNQRFFGFSLFFSYKFI